MIDLLQLPVLLKALIYALFCISSAWLVRAGIFGIVIDSARVVAPGVAALLLHQGVGAHWSIALALGIWVAAMLLFALAREKFGADDILLSLGLQATTFGVISFLVVGTLHQRVLPSMGSPSSIGIACSTTAMLVVTSVYFLSFSTLRVPLAQAAITRRPSGAYPGGGRRLRIGAILAAAICTGGAALASMTLGSVSLDQWRDGIGILLFGMAYALRGRALVSALAGASIALVETISTSLIVSVQSSVWQEVLSASYLLWGLIIIGVGAIKWKPVAAATI